MLRDYKANFTANRRGSLHFIHAASKLTLLLLRKGNTQRCFSYGIMWRTWPLKW
jgi:hypothetical protein